MDCNYNNIVNRLPPSLLDAPYPKDKFLVDYIFLNQTKLDVLMRTKVVNYDPLCPEDLPMMEKAIRRNSESGITQMNIKPMRLFQDPFRGGPNRISLCELYEGDKPADINTRHVLKEFLGDKQIRNEEPWMGFEQEYFITDQDGQILGSNTDFGPLNSKVNFGSTAGLQRQISELHLKACMLANLSVYGNVKETHFGQWEYQLGPVECLQLADELIVSRYLLNRVAEMFGVKISFDAVHYKDAAKTQQITSGLHLNYSTKDTRAENGIETINEHIKRLASVDCDKIFPFYDRNKGLDTKTRLSGVSQFTFQDLNSKRFYFRIPVPVQLKKRGYLEDRRPSADCDPYTAMLGFLKSLYTNELHDDM